MFGKDFCMNIVVIGLGSNLGLQEMKPEQIILAALNRLESEVVKEGGCVLQISSLYCTPPVYLEEESADQDAFTNAVAILKAPWCAAETLNKLHGIEHDYGRERQERWGARSLDLDLLFHGDNILPSRKAFIELVESEDKAAILTGQPVVPHPRAHERLFVMVPLVEIAPDFMHPVYNRPASRVLDDLIAADQEGFRKIKPIKPQI